MFEEKRNLRKKMKLIIKEYLSKNDIQKISAQICTNLIKSTVYKNSKAILCFLSSPYEIQTKTLLQKTREDKKILACPRVIGNGIMEFREIDSEVEIVSQIEEGAFGIFEPKESCKIFDFRKFKEELLVVVPCVAFTINGERLGHGKGFYDRFLSKINGNCNVVGLCLPCQIVQKIPTTPNDVKISQIFY